MNYGIHSPQKTERLKIDAHRHTGVNGSEENAARQLVSLETRIYTKFLNLGSNCTFFGLLCTGGTFVTGSSLEKIWMVRSLGFNLRID